MTVEQAGSRFHNFMERFAAFFERRWGGAEVEMIISTTEISQAILLFLFPTETMWNTRAFQDFAYWGWPAWPIGMLWLLAGAFSAVGLALAFLDNRLCAPFRWIGSFVSAPMWAWVAIKTGTILDWTIVYVIICFLFSLWSIRITLAALKRWEPWRRSR